MRALAILLVVACHVGLPGVAGGYIGVDVFFVLSGYLITGLMAREIENTGRLSLSNFYARRVRRLLPAASVVWIATLLLGLLVYSPLELLSPTITAASAALYVSNIRFALAQVAYFAAPVDSDPLLHSWSLGVEEQFYLLWPLILLALFQLGRRWHNARRTAALGIALISIASFALCVWLTQRSQPWAFFIAPTRFWEFGLGALAILLRLKLPKLLAPGALWSGVGIALLALAAVLFNNSSAFPGYLAALPAIGAAGLLLAGAAQPNQLIARMLSVRPLLWLGRHSYSWYLWHWPLITYARLLWPNPPLWLTTAAAALALGCSALTLRVLERPVRSSAYLQRRPLLSIGLGLALALVALAAAGLTRVYADKALSSPRQQLYAQAINDRPRIYNDGCNLGFLDLAPAHDCVYGDTGSAQTVVLFGDSHAAHWFPAVEALAKARHWRLVPLVKNSCPTAALATFFLDTLRRPYVECTQWQMAMLQKITAMRPALVIMSNAAGYIAANGGVNSFGVTADAWRDGLAQTARALAAANVAQVLIADTPTPNFDVPRCLSRADAALLQGGDCDFVTAKGLNYPMRRAEAAAAASVSSLHIIDMTSAICPAVRCATERDGLVLYTDSHHMTASFSASLAPALMAQIDAVIPPSAAR